MKYIIIAVVVLIILVAIGQATSPENASKAIQPYQAQVANDFEEQYNQVKLHGTMIDRCVRAGLVAEGYLQAKDNVNFAKWADIKSADCKAAGMPQ
jgi:hypothetical protein